MKPIWIVVVIIIIAVLGLGWWMWQDKGMEGAATGNEDAASAANEADTVNGADDSSDDSSDDEDGVSVDVDVSVGGGTVTVIYSTSGFTPSTITVKKGTTVTFVDQNANEEMWVGSDQHPSHTGYSGTSKDTHCASGAPSATAFDQCGVSGSYSFTFDKVGTWGYHNHRNSDDHGTVVVTQ